MRLRKPVLLCRSTGYDLENVNVTVGVTVYVHLEAVIEEACAVFNEAVADILLPCLRDLIKPEAGEPFPDGFGVGVHQLSDIRDLCSLLMRRAGEDPLDPSAGRVRDFALNFDKFAGREGGFGCCRDKTAVGNSSAVLSRTEALLSAACGAYHRSGCDSRDGDLFAGLPSIFKLAFKVLDLRLALRTGAGAVALVGAFGDDVFDAVCVGDLFADLFQDPAALMFLLFRQNFVRWFRWMVVVSLLPT